MREGKQDRRINRSTNQREALNHLLDFSRLKGGFSQVLIVDDEGELVASSTPMGKATALAPMNWVLQKTVDTLSGPVAFTEAETLIIQACEGNSLACHFIRHRLKGAILATIDGKMPPATEKILASTAESYLRIMTKR